MKYQYPTDLPDSSAARRRVKKKWLIPVSIAVVIGAIIIDSALRLVTTEYDMFSDRLPQNFSGFRILQLSDLHGRSFGRDNGRLVKAVKAAEPDIIVLTGDFIEGTKELPVVETLCSRLTEIAPVYFVSGNHDWASGEINALRTLLEDCGVKYLSNDYVELLRGGESIILAGVEDPNSRKDMMKPEELVDIINKTHSEKFVVLLAHRNDYPDKYPALKVDIIISGHGHGGLVRIPGVGGLFGANAELFPKYDSGVFKSGRYGMVVSRGLAPMTIPRIFNNPEIVVVNLY